MSIPDAELLDVACDVTIRFLGHGSYGTEEGALKALRRRVKNRTSEAYLTAFKLLCAVYNQATLAIPKHLKPGLKPTAVAEFEDIDFEACLKDLDQIEPGTAIGEKHWILNWCIFWHYLK